MSLLIAPRTMAVGASVGKAVLGPGATALTYGTPLWSIARTPQQRAWQAARLYAENYLIRLAENPVSQKGGATPWHLETEDEEEVGDDALPQFRTIRDLLEKPQSALPVDQQQPGLTLWRGMTTLTLRHMGLCGTTFWYLDQTEALGGTPLAILYVAPWRLFEVRTSAGQFLTWSLDKPYDEGGTLLDRANVLPFYLTPPDQGVWSTGLVEAGGAKAAIDPLIDRHIQRVLMAGGRLTGLISPKEGSTVTPDQWAQFIRDYRGITQDPDAAQRLQIVQGPVDYVQTSATMNDLQLMSVDERTRDAILGLWGVPRSQVGISAPAGLNSGATKSYDEAVLWQGAIHPRLQSFYETIQYGLLDRYKALGTTVELVIEEPSFDDDKPLYEIAQLAESLPLTRNQRLEMVGKDPLPDWSDDGEPLGIAIDLPFNLTVVGSGPTDTPRPTPAPVVVVMPPEPPPLLTAGQPADMMPGAPAKASRFEVLRRQVDATAVPKIKRAVQGVLAQQRADVVRYLRSVGLDHLKRKLDFRWNPRDEDRRLHTALKPAVAGIVQKVATRTETALRPAKAADVDFMDRVTQRVIRRGGDRVTGINRTTRDAIQDALRVALPDAGTIDDVIRSVEDLAVFSADRSELIARTESMFAYNDAALGSYEELGVTEVEAIDGDDDPECAERDGRVYSIEEAASIEDHPNGTLDWLPVVDETEGKAQALIADIVAFVEREPPVPVPTPSPDPEPAAAAAVSPVQVSIVNPVPAPAGGIEFTRDDAGRIVSIRPSSAIVFTRNADGNLQVEAQA